MTKAKAKLTAVKPPAKLVTKAQPAPTRNYWSGQEAEEIIQRVAEGEELTEEAERLDVLIDPETAMVWLRRNKNNRKLVQSTVQRYAHDMLAGNFPYTHQGIAFDKFGNLLDGQHRLHAITQSGCTVAMQVTVNMSPDVKLAIDQGKSRSSADVASLKAGTQVEASMAAIAARMMAGTEYIYQRYTRTDHVDFIIKHLTAIIYAMENLPSKVGITNRSNRAVVARAWYTADHLRLARFCRILITGGYAPDEEIVFKLREQTQGMGGNRKDAKDAYLKTEWVLNKFLLGENPVLIRKAEREMFPLPEEKEKVDETTS